MIDPDRLRRFAAAVLSTCAVPEQHAALVADSLVTADLWGHQSHGVMRLGWYVARIRSGVMRPVTEISTCVEGGVYAVLDGRDGIGQVVADRAMRDAIRRAKQHGVGTVAVRNSNHFGTAAYFTRLAPPEGCIALLTTNSSPAMAPWGGRAKRTGNNPWSVAAPAGQFPPMVLDISNTVVARGKIHVAGQRGEPIPHGWALNTEGEPTIDPAEALAGIILPMAEHKGYAIAVMLDVLSGVLTGSEFGTGVTGPYQAKDRSGCGHLMIVLDIERLLPLTDFNARMEQLVHQLRSTPLAPGFDEILYPGELEYKNDRLHRERGLDLPRRTLDDLVALARSTEVAADFLMEGGAV